MQEIKKPEWMNQLQYDLLCDACFKKATALKANNIKPICESDIFEITDLLIILELEHIEKSMLSDSNIDYNDEIISIEEMGELDTIDITVTGDNLFYCNDILTKNSIGLPSTVDFMLAIISTEELEKSGQIMIKQLKNRFGDPNTYKRFIVGIDRSRMKLYDIDSVSKETEEPAGFGLNRTDRTASFEGINF